MTNETKTKMGHNSKTDYEGSYYKLERAYHRLKDILCDSISCSLDLQKHDLEDVRVSTRVADRFRNLEIATYHNEEIRKRIDALKPIAYKSTASDADKAHPRFNNSPISKYEAERLRSEFGNEIADFELAKAGYVEENNE
ncbi:hypothetical protein OAN79_00585 [Candidatus Pelagibacter sp.]|nr:hypothetical protein [Candidatus Pelagibacter sp.]